VAYALIRLVPFRWFAGEGVMAATDPVLGPARDARAVGVRRAIVAAARRLPWHSTCLMLALAGRTLLRRRGVASTLVIGVARNDGVFAAHAWLLAEDGVVCGGREAAGYTRIGRFV
jgi:hypothetical protein